MSLFDPEETPAWLFMNPNNPPGQSIEDLQLLAMEIFKVFQGSVVPQDLSDGLSESKKALPAHFLVESQLNKFDFEEKRSAFLDFYDEIFLISDVDHAVRVKNKNGKSAVMLAAEKGDCFFLKKLEERGCLTFNSEFIKQKNILSKAISSGSEELVNWLLSKIDDENLSDHFFHNPGGVELFLYTATQSKKSVFDIVFNRLKSSGLLYRLYCRGGYYAQKLLAETCKTSKDKKIIKILVDELFTPETLRVIFSSNDIQTNPICIVCDRYNMDNFLYLLDCSTSSDWNITRLLHPRLLDCPPYLHHQMRENSNLDFQREFMFQLIKRGLPIRIFMRKEKGDYCMNHLELKRLAMLEFIVDSYIDIGIKKSDYLYKNSNAQTMAHLLAHFGSLMLENWIKQGLKLKLYQDELLIPDKQGNNFLHIIAIEIYKSDPTELEPLDSDGDLDLEKRMYVMMHNMLLRIVKGLSEKCDDLSFLKKKNHEGKTFIDYLPAELKDDYEPLVDSESFSIIKIGT